MSLLVRIFLRDALFRRPFARPALFRAAALGRPADQVLLATPFVGWTGRGQADQRGQRADRLVSQHNYGSACKCKRCIWDIMNPWSCSLSLSHFDKN